MDSSGTCDILPFRAHVKSFIDTAMAKFGAYFPVVQNAVVPTVPRQRLFDLNAEQWELLSVVLRLMGTIGIGYVTIRWLLKQMDPTHDQKAQAQKTTDLLLSKLGMKSTDLKLNSYEVLIAQQLIPTDSIDVSWNDLGGCDHLINELEDAVILPLRMGYKSPLLAPPKGVLLYGPPGCGKTMLAKAVAKAANARFINLQVSILTDKWYGESEKLAYAVFSVAKKLQPVIIFIDEIDSFLRVRQSHDHEATAMMKAQFMSHWDGFASDPSCHIVIMGATNRPHDVDAAILRRMPARYNVKLPNAAQRKAIFEVILRAEPLAADVDLAYLSGITERFSGSDIKELCRVAAVMRAKEVLSSGAAPTDPAAKPISQTHLTNAVAKLLSTKNIGRNPLLDLGAPDGEHEDSIGLD